MDTFVKNAYDAGVQQAMVDFGLTKSAKLPPWGGVEALIAAGLLGGVGAPVAYGAYKHQNRPWHQKLREQAATQIRG